MSHDLKRVGYIYPNTLGVHRSRATDICRIIRRYLSKLWTPSTHVMKISSTVRRLFVIFKSVEV